MEKAISSDFLDQAGTFSQEYERKYIAKIVDLMEAYEKPVIGVSLTSTGKKVIRSVDGRRYSGVFYQTPETAVAVLSKMVAYQRFVDRA